MFELYREDYMTYREKKPFATVATADEAENAAREEILEGDSAIVWVAGVGILAVASVEYDCAHCDCKPGNVGVGAMVWYRGENTEVPYCSHECAMGMEVAAQ